MQLMTTVYICDDNWFEELVGVITIDKKQAEKYLKYIEIISEIEKEYPEIYSLSISDYKMDYIIAPYDKNTGDVLSPFNKITNEDEVVIETNINIDDYSFQSVDVQEVRVTKRNIVWTAYIKHTNIEIFCGDISIELIKKIARG